MLKFRYLLKFCPFLRHKERSIDCLNFRNPSGFLGISWEASNGAGLSYNSQRFEPNSGSAALQGYYGTSTIVSVRMSRAYGDGIS